MMAVVILIGAFLVAMIAQTSDVDVQNTKLRKVTTLHAIVSFCFNTVLIAMSVNAVVARASSEFARKFACGGSVTWAGNAPHARRVC